MATAAGSAVAGLRLGDAATSEEACEEEDLVRGPARRGGMLRGGASWLSSLCWETFFCEERAAEAEAATGLQQPQSKPSQHGSHWWFSACWQIAQPLILFSSQMTIWTTRSKRTRTRQWEGQQQQPQEQLHAWQRQPRTQERQKGASAWLREARRLLLRRWRVIRSKRMSAMSSPLRCQMDGLLLRCGPVRLGRSTQRRSASATQTAHQHRRRRRRRRRRSRERSLHAWTLQQATSEDASSGAADAATAAVVAISAVLARLRLMRARTRAAMEADQVETGGATSAAADAAVSRLEAAKQIAGTDGLNCITATSNAWNIWKMSVSKVSFL